MLSDDFYEFFWVLPRTRGLAWMTPSLLRSRSLILEIHSVYATPNLSCVRQPLLRASFGFCGGQEALLAPPPSAPSSPSLSFILGIHRLYDTPNLSCALQPLLRAPSRFCGGQEALLGFPLSSPLFSSPSQWALIKFGDPKMPYLVIVLLSLFCNYQLS